MRHLDMMSISTFSPGECILYEECNFSQHDPKQFSSCNLPVMSSFCDSIKQQSRFFNITVNPSVSAPSRQTDVIASYNVVIFQNEGGHICLHLVEKKFHYNP